MKTKETETIEEQVASDYPLTGTKFAWQDSTKSVYFSGMPGPNFNCIHLMQVRECLSVNEMQKNTSFQQTGLIFEFFIISLACIA